MIGKIKGKLLLIKKNQGLIETLSGISYWVFLTPSITSQIKPVSPIDIFTYLQIRDDAHVLFGFQTLEEYDFFVLLLTVPGVGPKTAFNVISFTRSNELATAVKENNIEYFTRIPGLGKKTAMKIILELSQKLKEEFSLEKMYLSSDDTTVIDALISLGYTNRDASSIFQKIPKNLSIEEKIKHALKLSHKTS